MNLDFLFLVMHEQCIFLLKIYLKREQIGINLFAKLEGQDVHLIKIRENTSNNILKNDNQWLFFFV